MIPKMGKLSNKMYSYKSMWVHLIISYKFSKTIHKILEIIIKNKKLLPDYRFGFREKQSTIKQVLGLTNIIENPLEGKEYFSCR